MTIDNEIKKGITKGDIILIACVILLIAVLFLLSFKGSDKKLTAEIYAHGEKIHSIALSEVGESYTLRINRCELLIEKDGVTFLSSDCADQLCVKKGKLTRQGDTMACVPEKVVVVLSGAANENIDSVAY